MKRLVELPLEKQNEIVRLAQDLTMAKGEKPVDTGKVERLTQNLLNSLPLGKLN